MVLVHSSSDMSVSPRKGSSEQVVSLQLSGLDVPLPGCPICAPVLPFPRH